MRTKSAFYEVQAEEASYESDGDSLNPQKARLANGKHFGQ